MKLSQTFFLQPTLSVAKSLLGKKLVFDNCEGIINETEAYIGEDDPACHAARGKTPRNAVMYGPAGVSYVYFIYGMYFCLNFVTEKEGFPAAVLIRGVIPTKGVSIMRGRRKNIHEKNLCNGPGKLCTAFDITKDHSGINICKNSEFHVFDEGRSISQEMIKSTPRVGIREGKEKLWRFLWEKDTQAQSIQPSFN